MNNERTVLLLSDDDDLIESAQMALSSDPDYRLLVCNTEKEAENRLDEIEINILVCDSHLLEDPIKNVAFAARLSHSQMSRVLLSSPDDAERANEVANNAAPYLFLMKPLSMQQFAIVAKRALELSELSRRHRVLSRELKISIDDNIFSTGDQRRDVKGGFSQFERLVYISAEMAELTSQARAAAATNLPVLIHGETGTGKELLARAIHYNSPCKDSPLQVQNCGGISEDTLHSELFGHIRGAFPGAISDRLGLFRAADGGTVFLDEISEISPGFQVCLLRFLQEGEVKPLGSDEMQHSTVRVIAASNRPLEALVEAGKFRRDLYYRLKGFELRIPPLRDRRKDIPVLTDFFIEKYAGVVGRNVLGVTSDALAKLCAYDFPGNVRELESEVRRMVAVAEQGGYISERHLSDVFKHVVSDTDETPTLKLEEGKNLKEMVEALEQQMIQAVLTRNRWNQSRTASELGLSRAGLSNKIKRYGLESAKAVV